MSRSERDQVCVRENRVYVDGDLFATITETGWITLREKYVEWFGMGFEMPPGLADCYGRALVAAAKVVRERETSDASE